MQEYKVQGIVLRRTPYRDSQHIITLFTDHAGLISLMVKGISRKSYHLLALTTPFCLGEFLYTKGSSDLLKFLDGTLLSEHLELRRSLKHLQVGGEMLQALLLSQLPAKPSYPLYSLLKSYLGKLPTFASPNALLVSFYLKMLKHEGLIPWSMEDLENPLYASSFLLAEEKPKAPFSPSEWTLLKELLDMKSFATLREKEIDDTLRQKVQAYFKRQIHQ